MTLRILSKYRWQLFVFLFFLTHSLQAAVNLAVELGPNPVQRNEVVNVAITVANPGGSAGGAITVRMLYPSGLSGVSHGVISDAGTCPVQIVAGGLCDPTEILEWDLGTLPAGSGHTVTLPPSVINDAATVPDGTVIPFAVEVLENGVLAAQATRNTVVISAPAFDIAVDEDANPVGPGEPLTYTVTYSNRATANALSTNLSLPLPPGVTFVSATGGGVLNGNTVQWNLNTLPAQSGGRQKVKVTVNNSVAQGSLLNVDAATINGLVNSLSNTSTALATTRVQANNPLALGLILNPDPVLRNQVINTSLIVTNQTNATLFGVTLRLRFPESLNGLAHTAISDAGTCPAQIIAGGQCDSTEIVVWNLGNLPAGGNRTVTLPPRVINDATSVPNGTLITFDANVSEDTGTQTSVSKTDLVGVYVNIDTDGDGVSDNADNCTLIANAKQTDTDGDKIGNACDPDFNQNGIVDQFDFSRLKACFGKAASVCPNEDLNGNGIVDQFDFSRLKAMFGKKPGPSGLVN